MCDHPSACEALNHKIRNATPSIALGIIQIKKGMQAIEEATREHIPENDLTIENRIILVARLLGVDPNWCLAVAQVESAMGKHQLSPTGAKGIFQMTSIAMKDLLLEMENKHSYWKEWIDICNGILFLGLLKIRWKTKKDATNHYCDPNDRSFYWPKVAVLMEKFSNDVSGLRKDGE
jgi:hypothetical protein